jgi:hypothetical protein
MGYFAHDHGHCWRNHYNAPELGDLRGTTSVADWAVNRRIIGDLIFHQNDRKGFTAITDRSRAPE